MELFLTVCVSSLTLGLLYALFATGMGLVLRTSGELNLAHGDSLMLATYVGLGTVHLADVRSVAVLATVASAAAVAMAAYLAIYAPVAHHQRAGIVGLGFLPAFGVALIVRNIAVEINPAGSERFSSLFAGGPTNLFGDYQLPAAGWWILAAGILVPLGLALYLRNGATGRRMRAVADDQVLAQLAGIPMTRTLASSYAIAGAIGGLAGALFASFFGQVFISLGWQATLKGFVAAVLGGVSWVRGALIGGILLGTAESFVSAYVSTRLKDVVTFLLLIGVMLVVPRGVLAAGRLRQA